MIWGVPLFFGNTQLENLVNLHLEITFILYLIQPTENISTDPTLPLISIIKKVMIIMTTETVKGYDI